MDHYFFFSVKPGLLLLSLEARLMSELLHSTFGSKKANGLQSPLFGPAPLPRPRVREKSALTAELTSTAFGALVDG